MANRARHNLLGSASHHCADKFDEAAMMAHTRERHAPSGGLASDVVLISIPNTTRVAGFSRSTTYRLIASGQLRARKLGTKTMIEADSLRAYLAALPTVELAGDYSRETSRLAARVGS